MDKEVLSDAFADEVTLLIRVDFSDDFAWDAVRVAVTKPVDFDKPTREVSWEDKGAYLPNIDAVDDPGNAHLTPETLLSLAPPGEDVGGYVLLADDRSIAEARAGGLITVNYVDLSDPVAPIRTFRCAAPVVSTVECNLAIAHVDFWNFADAVDETGVLRGFDD